MRLPMSSIEAWPLAARLSGALGASPNSWAVVVAPLGREADAADALYDELESLHDGVIRRVDVTARTQWLEATTEAEPDEVLMLTLTAVWDDEDWRALDMQRSRLRRAGLTVLIVDRAAAQRMVSAAPNLWSWIGGMVWALDGLEGPDV